MNKLFFGDCLDIMKRYIPNEAVDLIYLDPPWNKKKRFNMLFSEKDGSQAASQIKAFEDIWHWDEAAAEAYEDVVENGPEKVSLALQGFRTFLGTCDMLAYLSMMAQRLIDLRRVLKPTGSIYFHCDPASSHYLKTLMDSLFGYANFRNEIVWRIGWVSGYKTQKVGWIRNHDIILYYVMSPNFTFNKEYIKYPDGYVRRDGKPPTGKGFPIEDTWNCHSGDILNSIMIMSFSREKLGYPTQKPISLLERIIKASSNEGDVVLDPFCGCGTTIDAAQRLNRSWIGIDIAYLAMTVIEKRLNDTYGDDVEYELVGEPISVSDARALAIHDRFHFQTWALGLVGARPSDPKRGADKGIDGRLFFHDGVNGQTKQIVLSVKSGKPGISHIRELWEVTEREQAEIGVLIAMEKSTRTMKSEAAAAGFYQSPLKTKHPKLQIITIKELLSGKDIDYPRTRADVTYKKAGRFKGRLLDQLDLIANE